MACSYNPVTFNNKESIQRFINLVHEMRIEQKAGNQKGVDRISKLLDLQLQGPDIKPLLDDWLMLPVETDFTVEKN